jgi:hypothetical protein
MEDFFLAIFIIFTRNHHLKKSWYFLGQMFFKHVVYVVCYFLRIIIFLRSHGFHSLVSQSLNSIEVQLLNYECLQYLGASC